MHKRCDMATCEGQDMASRIVRILPTIKPRTDKHRKSGCPSHAVPKAARLGRSKIFKTGTGG